MSVSLRDLRRIAAGIRNIVARSVVTMVDDERKMQEVQVLPLQGEVLDQAERWQDYGLSSHPPLGAEALLVFVGADRSHPAAVKVDDRRARPRGLKPGEVKVYQANGDYIHLKNGNEVEVSTTTLTVKAAKSVSVQTEEVDFKASKRFSVETGIFEVTAAEQISLVSALIGLHGALTMTDQTGSGDVDATLQGSLTATQYLRALVDVLAAGVSGKSHTHPYTSGGGTTGPPNAAAVASALSALRDALQTASPTGQVEQKDE
ncbi:phage baseplate assembly protein V [Desulfovibrio sp. OttesenSCG-928-C06]|nr:phage baseplate assembly protein V [Desulfovibrio sp. OttesenSCG-928-C06]